MLRFQCHWPKRHTKDSVLEPKRSKRGRGRGLSRAFPVFANVNRWFCLNIEDPKIGCRRKQPRPGILKKKRKKKDWPIPHLNFQASQGTSFTHRDPHMYPVKPSRANIPSLSMCSNFCGRHGAAENSALNAIPKSIIQVGSPGLRE